MKVEIELPQDTVERLESEANRLQIPLVQLASLAVVDFASRPKDEFSRVVEYILDKNEELLKRLS